MTGAAEHMKQIRAVRPTALSVKPLGAGYENQAYIVDNTEVFRFIKSNALRNNLQYDVAILRALEGKTSLTIPKVTAVSSTYDYVAVSYIKGNVLTIEEIAKFSRAQKTMLAQNLTQFICEINDVLTVRQTAAWRAQMGAGYPDDKQYYLDVLGKAEKQASPYAALYNTYYDKTQRIIDGDNATKIIVLHGDIHVGNMIFSDDNQLVGIIDFGDCGPGTLYNELRQLYRIDTDVVAMMASNLASRFEPINMALVKNYAILHELSVLIRSEHKLVKDLERLDLAETLLSQWLGLDWKEQI